MMRQQPKITTAFKETKTKIPNSIYSKHWGLQHCSCREHLLRHCHTALALTFPSLLHPSQCKMTSPAPGAELAACKEQSIAALNVCRCSEQRWGWNTVPAASPCPAGNCPFLHSCSSALAPLPNSQNIHELKLTASRSEPSAIG